MREKILCNLHKKFINIQYNSTKYSLMRSVEHGRKKNEGQTNQEKKEENSYEFLKETIKAKPWNRKKLAKQVGKLLASGAVFGLAAAVVFSMCAGYDR